MRECAIFASFAQREAAGLMVYEAMASGCHIVGYSGYTDLYNQDYLNSDNGDWIPEGEYLLFAQKLCQAIELFALGRENPKIKAGLDLIENNFRKRHFEQNIKDVYGKIIGIPL